MSADATAGKRKASTPKEVASPPPPTPRPFGELAWMWVPWIGTGLALLAGAGLSESIGVPVAWVLHLFPNGFLAAVTVAGGLPTVAKSIVSYRMPNRWVAALAMLLPTIGRATHGALSANVRSAAVDLRHSVNGEIGWFLGALFPFACAAAAFGLVLVAEYRGAPAHRPAALPLPQEAGEQS